MRKRGSETSVMNEMDGNWDNMEKVYGCVEEILGADFDGIYGYLSEILESRFQYIVLMSRRCQVLHRLFMRIFERDEKVVDTDAVLLSDKALPFYLDSFRDGDRIAILDDVIVHGRAISEVYDMVSDSDKSIEVKLFSYAADENMDCLSKKAKENLKVFYPCSTSEWRELSGKIVDCIQISNIPYTSFVTSFFQYQVPTIWDKIDKINDLRKIDIQDPVQERQNQYSRIVYDENWEKPAVFSTFSLGECIRVYWNKTTKSLTVTPYVFIRSLHEGEAEELCKAVEAALPEKFANIKHMLEKRFNSERWEKALKEYKMRIITCILSNYYWDDFRHRYQLPEPEYTDQDTLRESFGTSVGEELCAVRKDYIIDSWLQCCSLLPEPKVQMSLSETEAIMKELFGKHKKLCLKRYFSKAWFNDENRAKQKEGRAQGVTIDYFLKCVNDLKADKSLALAQMINSWDVGLAATNFSVDSTRHMIECCNTPGEQSYKIILENNSAVMKFLITVSNIVTKGEAKRKGKDYEEYREQLLLELLEEFHQKKVLDDYNEIRQIIMESKGYLNAWDQPQVFSCCKADCEEVDEIQKRFIEKTFNLE